MPPVPGAQEDETHHKLQEHLEGAGAALVEHRAGGSVPG